MSNFDPAERFSLPDDPDPDDGPRTLVGSGGVESGPD